MSYQTSAFLDELARVNRKLRTLFDARAKAHGLTLSRARLLFHLAQSDGQTQVKLAELLEIEQPTLVRLIDGLEAKGLIERRSVNCDRRSKQVFLTAAARRQAEDIIAFANDMRAQVLEGIDEADIEAATEVLGKAARNIEAAS